MNDQSTDDLLDFRRFIDEKLSNGGAHLSPEEALDEWREKHLGPDEIDETEVAAIQEAIDDMERGDRGRDADEVIAEIRAELRLPKL